MESRNPDFTPINFIWDTVKIYFKGGLEQYSKPDEVLLVTEHFNR